MNSLGSSSEIVRNKLIIMYLLDRLGMPVSNNGLTTLVLETRLMNYFMLQQCLNELREGKLLELCNGMRPQLRGEMSLKPDAVSAGTDNGNATESYILAEPGKKALQYFNSMIPHGLKKRLDKLAAESRGELRHDSLISADLIEDDENNFSVLCRMEENGFLLMELKAAAGAKKDARTICENWRKHSAAIYADIMEILTKKRD